MRITRLTTVLLVLLSCAVAQAGMLNINWNRDADNYTGQGLLPDPGNDIWNRLGDGTWSGGSPGAYSYTSGPLVFSDGSPATGMAGPVTVTTTGGSWGWDGFGPDNTLRGGFWWGQNNSNSVLKVTGMAPNQNYTVAAMGLRPNATGRVMNLDINGTTLQITGNDTNNDLDPNNWATFASINSGASGEIVMTPTYVSGDNWSQYYFNAVQIQGPFPAATPPPPPPTTLMWTFDEPAGPDEQGWVDVLTSGVGNANTDFDAFDSGWGRSPESGNGWLAPGTNGASGWNQRDGQNDPFVIRSPSFVLGDGEISFHLQGGVAGGAAPGNFSGLGGTGFLGLALRNDATGDYVMAAGRPGNGDGYQKVTFSAANLAPYVGGTFTLDYIDDKKGGWGLGRRRQHHRSDPDPAGRRRPRADDDAGRRPGHRLPGRLHPKAAQELTRRFARRTRQPTRPRRCLTHRRGLSLAGRTRGHVCSSFGG